EFFDPAMMKELIEIQKHQVGIQERQVSIETQQVGIQNQQTEILKMMAEAMNRPLEIHLPNLSPGETKYPDLAEESLRQAETNAETNSDPKVIIDEKQVVVKDVREAARQWYLEDKSRLKLTL